MKEPIKCYGVDNPELCKKCIICQVACHRCNGKQCIGKQVTWQEALKQIEREEEE